MENQHFAPTGSKFVIGPIYYEYGSMVITFDNSESALNALDQLKVSKQEYEGGKKILGESTMCPQYNKFYFYYDAICQV